MIEVSSMVLKLWEQKKLPLVGGLLLPDGRLYKNLANNIFCEYEMLQENSKDYSSWFSRISVLHSRSYQGYSVYCGDGSYGSDGFILVLNKDSTLHWLIMDDINPIEQLTVENGVIHALNNLQQKFTFPIMEPEKYQIPTPD